MANKIRSFTDLDTWKHGHKLVIQIYQLVKSFPAEEKFGLSDQMRRCAVSITSNIAEGFSRKTNKDKTQFYHTALGSLTELQNQLMICRDIGYCDKSVFEDLANQSVTVSKLINGLISYLSHT